LHHLFLLIKHLVKVIRWLTAPIALIYSAIVIFIKNKNDGNHAPFFTLNVGNLSTGGTGKTPHIEWLAKNLQTKLNLVLLSRGYGRTNKNIFSIHKNMPASQTGDEPLQFKKKYPNIPVWVAQKRLEAMPRIQEAHPKTDCILLDDAFQHWALATDFKILLTTYQTPFYKDYVLPLGNLREPRNGYRRADIIIITKCPLSLSFQEQTSIKTACNPLPHQQIFFSTYQYGAPYHWTKRHRLPLITSTTFFLITGLANPKPLEDYLYKNDVTLYTKHYRDHHPFSEKDVETIIQRYAKLPKNTLLLTTEKDATRLYPYQEIFEAKNIDIWVIPIEVVILNNQASILLDQIEQKITTFDPAKRQ